jgi:hypothetical protein
MPLDIPELAEIAINYLHDSPAALKRFSLVNKNWALSSQFHLFSYYALETEADCARLSGLLKSTPRIAGLITHIAIALPRNEAPPYTTLSTIHLTNLRKLTVYTLPPQAALPVVQSLIALPSIMHICMMQADEPTRPFSLFALRTANLDTLEIRSRAFSGDPYMPISDWTSPGPGFRVATLLLSSGNTEHLRNSRISPFDLSALRRMVITEDRVYAPDLNMLFRQFGSSLHELEINGTIGNPSAQYSAAFLIPFLPS